LWKNHANKRLKDYAITSAANHLNKNRGKKDSYGCQDEHRNKNPKVDCYLHCGYLLVSHALKHVAPAVTRASPPKLGGNLVNPEEQQ
jgi:hypothetical protein